MSHGNTSHSDSKAFCALNIFLHIGVDFLTSPFEEQVQYIHLVQMSNKSEPVSAQVQPDQRSTVHKRQWGSVVHLYVFYIHLISIALGSLSDLGKNVLTLKSLYVYITNII